MGTRRQRRGTDLLAPALRRLEGVRVTVDESGTRAEVFGLGHRHPVSVPVSFSLAARLVASGTPLEICHR